MGKSSGKPAHQLLFSEALHQQKHPPAEDPPHHPHINSNMAEDTQGASMDRILQEISAVWLKLEDMDSAMVALTAETRSICLEIAGFQSQISGLDQRVTTVETQVASWTDRDQELLHLRSKLTDLEDRSRRNNIRILGFPEGIEGADILSYLRDTLSKLTNITFDPPLEFERVHRLVTKRQDGKGHPRPIIACLLRHGQACQLLQAARTQCPLQLGTLEIRLSADFSQETADRRRAFLSLHPRLRHLDVKFGLDLRIFLERLQDQTQSMETTTQTLHDTRGLFSGARYPETTSDPEGRATMDPQTRVRDLERLTKSYNDRGQVLLAVAMYTQLSDRDKSRSPLKPTMAPT
ncbi:hypothetical protein NDU88_007122 [Pleurodeles waltl]|uniref:Uncharacterized protein n=1 Tax=Pleurodeles waltl TaxID=8319 RepID=A0AAV7TZ52_PLEWA|nr:hypothetical protein NDU88_007122 [Pleurodeles waltl]